MAEHNELGKLEKKWQSNLKDGYTILRPMDFSKAEIDIIAQKKIHLLLLKNSLPVWFYKIL
jgi:hypothetical protein